MNETDTPNGFLKTRYTPGLKRMPRTAFANYKKQSIPAWAMIALNSSTSSW
jgi:hypothetical protein